MFKRAATKIFFFRSLMLTIRLVNVIALARIVSVETYGAYIVLITALTVISEISSLGLSSYLQRETYARRVDPIPLTIYVSRRSSLFYVFLVMIPSMGYGYVNSLDLTLILLIPIFLVIEKNFELFVIYFISSGKTRIIQYSAGMSSAISSIFLLAHTINPDIELHLYFWIRLFASIPLALVVLRIPYKGFVSKEVNSLNLILKNFGLLNLANTLRASDLVFVSILADSIQVGLYSAATKLIVPFIIIVGLTSPYFSDYCSKLDLPQMLRLKSALKLIMLGLIFVSSASSLFSGFIINLVYGENFMDAANVLAIMMLSVPFVLINPLFAIIAISEGKEKIIMKATIRNTIILLLCVSIGALLQGALGAALGFLFSSALRAHYLAFLK